MCHQHCWCLSDICVYIRPVITDDQEMEKHEWCRPWYCVQEQNATLKGNRNRNRRHREGGNNHHSHRLLLRAQHAQHVVQRAQHDDPGLRRSISNITLATQPGNIRFTSAGEESSPSRIKQERVSSAVVSSKSVSSSWVSYSGRVLGPWPTPVATSDVYTGGPNAKPSMEERKRVTRRQQQCKQT
jgi:hypothetical protein